MTPLNSSRVPPGFRFHPTDEELVGYYLQKKVASKRIDLDVIHEIDLYKLEPWDLHERCKIGSAEQNEWYFFSHKDKKYPTGTRTNRATAAGFWKATGRDKAIHAKYKLIGMRKTLVFYKGRAPNGQKTDWIMHEYRLEDELNTNSNTNTTIATNNDDGWVVCRVFKKRSSHKLQERDMTYCYDDQIALLPELESPSKFITDFPYQSIVSCKQEFGETSSEFHDPFCHQLPQLESPRMHPPAPQPLPAFKGLLPHHLLPPPTSFPLPPPAAAAHFQALSDRLFHNPQQEISIQHPIHQQQQRPVTDWRMVDKIVAAQLSNEGDASSRTTTAATTTTPTTTKDRFVDSTPPPASQEESDDHSEDVALLLRLSKQHDFNNNSNNNNNNNNSSSVNDGDLWSFHGR